MRKLPAFAAMVLASTYGLVKAADWLQYGGDPQHSGWQRHDKFLTPANAGQFKLLWKRKLDNISMGMNSLSAPTLLGPIVTHRGIKELVFIAGASDNLYAVDADLGKLFWKVHFDSTSPAEVAATPKCGAGLTAAPAIAPAPPTPGKPVNLDDDEGTTPLRPLYVLSSDGNLHNLRPSDGRDMAAPLKFIPANANASNLNLAGNTIYTTTSYNCGGAPDGVWGIDVTGPNAKASFTALKNAGSGSEVSVGFGGAVYTGQNFAAPVVFRWKGREITAEASERQGLFLLSGKLLATAPLGTDIPTSLSTWEDASGVRSVYAATRANIRAFTVTAGPQLKSAWISRELVSPAPPVIVNEMLFVLSRGDPNTHATLYALDAATGKELYTSGDAIDSFSRSSGLAVANGHVCFGTFDNTLYCFGFPIEI